MLKGNSMEREANLSYSEMIRPMALLRDIGTVSTWTRNVSTPSSTARQKG